MTPTMTSPPRPVTTAPPLSASLASITGLALTLGTSVSAWEGDLAAARPISVHAAALLQQTRHATATATATAATATTALPLAEVLALAHATRRLSGVVQTTLRAIVDQKPRFDPLLVVSPVVLLGLRLQREATGALAGVVLGLLPRETRGVARGFLRPIDEAFGRAIGAYVVF